MSLARDLLDQARHLATKERRRPQQASLRRAISTAYYALFHLLTESAARDLIRGRGPERSALRATLRRAFAHGEMKRVCVAWRGGTAPQDWQCALGSGQIPRELRKVADAFVELQEARHEADYDVGKTYTRQEARELVRRGEQAFSSWETTRRDDPLATSCFLLALLLHGRLRG